jgi:molecular chaperone GrpE
MTDTEQRINGSKIKDATTDGQPGAPGPQTPGEPAGAPPVTSGAASEREAPEAAELAGDLEQLVKTAAERDEYLALAQRTQADFENYRKRVSRESAAAQERGVSSLAKELLPALDNLDRALEEAGSAVTGAGAAGEAGAHEDPLLEGVRLVRAELTAALARARIESFCPVGEPFDPAVHEAVATAELAPGGQPSGTVVEVYQPGYRLGESIIRPARVVVAA